MKATLLQPTWSDATTCKTYKLVNSKPEVSEVYNLGKFFYWRSVPFDGISGLYSLLSKCANKSFFRIPGTPLPDLGKIARRQKSNFVDSGTRILVLDGDDWTVPPGYDLKNKDSIRKAVQYMLCNEMGLSFLKDAAFVFLMSSSAWSYKVMRAHMYFVLSESVELSFLHEWGKHYNEVNTKHKIDYSMYRSVQPDYISKRICEFKDPLSDSLRLTLHCDGLSPYVDKAAMIDHMNNDIEVANAYSISGGNYNVVSAKTPSDIADTWENTLKLCGSAQHGINDPAHRACAQLVQRIGTKTVEKNINFYVDKVYNMAWSAINKHGVRGNKKDRDYYDRTRIRNYLTTSIEKNFGEGTDVVNSEIAETIKRVISGASPAILFSNDMLDKFRHIRTNDPGKWTVIRSIFKQKLKGKVTVADLDKALSSSGKPDLSFMIDKVISSFEWVEGSIDQGLYCKREQVGGYNLQPMESGLDSIVYAKSLELFGNAIPSQFERNVIKVLMARSGDNAATPFASALVENRCYTQLKNGMSTLYYNMGIDLKGRMRTCVVNANGVQFIDSKESPVTWSLYKTTMNCDITPDRNNTQPDRLILNYLHTFKNFVTTESAEDLFDLIAWQVSAVVNTGTAPILEVSGASGDGKSTSALFTKELIDPTSSDIRDGQDLHNGFYKKEDFAKILKSRHVTIFDNLSNLKPFMQDLLCSVATGWKYDLRVMYTQNFLSLVIKKPLIITCLAPIITNQDLRSRSISVNMSLKKKKFKTDIYDEWNKCKADMRLGFMYLVSKVIGHVDSSRLRKKNMNDRDLWATAARTVIMQLIGYKNGNEIEIQHMITKRKIDRDIQEVLTTPKTAQIVAWVAFDRTTFDKRNPTIGTATDLYIAYKYFINENMGVKFLVQGTKVETSLLDIPNNPRSFGIILSNIRNDIHSATGWFMDNSRSNGRRVKVFSYDNEHIPFIERSGM